MPTIPAYIFDLDGTLALRTGRDPYDFEKCDEDAINQDIVEILRNLYQERVILIVTGREDKFSDQTLDWLETYDIRYDNIFFRPTGDNRPDDVIKAEIYHDKIKRRYHVVAVFDDRTRVVEMWRQLGLTCCQVAQGDF